MKLSFTTLGCPDWSFDKILKEAQKIGFEGIEIRGIEGKMRAEEIPQFFPENIESTKKHIADHNLEIMGFGSSACFHTQEIASAGIEEAKKAIDVCSMVQIPSVRVFGDAIPVPEKADETISLVARSVASLCEYASDKNVNIAFEIHGDFNTIEAISGLIEHCKNYPNFGIIWDIAHSDCAYADNWYPFYEVIRPHIKQTHFKDHIRNADGSHTLCIVGEGDIPIAEIVKTLKEDGYTGYYSLEWEKKWQPYLPEPEIAFPAYYNYMKNLLK